MMGFFISSFIVATSPLQIAAVCTRGAHAQCIVPHVLAHSCRAFVFVPGYVYPALRTLHSTGRIGGWAICCLSARATLRDTVSSVSASVGVMIGQDRASGAL